MLEPYAGKGARTVLRGGGRGNPTSLPDYAKARIAAETVLRRPSCSSAASIKR